MSWGDMYSGSKANIGSLLNHIMVGYCCLRSSTMYRKSQISFPNGMFVPQLCVILRVRMISVQWDRPFHG
jgi:hypothetical protein